MKLKICQIKREYDPYVFKDGKNKLYAIWAVVHVQTDDNKVSEIEAKVVCYGKKGNNGIEPAFVFSKDLIFTEKENCENIKRETKEYNGNVYEQFTVYTKKQDRIDGKYQSRQRMSIDQFDFAISYSKRKADELTANIVDSEGKPKQDYQLTWSYFSAILKAYVDCVSETKTELEKKSTDVANICNGTVVENSPASNPFDDNDIPF